MRRAVRSALLQAAVAAVIAAVITIALDNLSDQAVRLGVLERRVDLLENPTGRGRQTFGPWRNP